MKYKMLKESNRHLLLVQDAKMNETHLTLGSQEPKSIPSLAGGTVGSQGSQEAQKQNKQANKHTKGSAKSLEILKLQ